MGFGETVLQHLPLVLYLLFVVSLSYHLLRAPTTPFASLTLLTSLLALLFTWYYMFAYIWRSFHDSRMLAGPHAEFNTTVWLRETSLFKQAWEYVCSGAERWWWSSQLCTFTVGTWTVFLYAEASRHPALRQLVSQYMLLGQAVAISFASGLFLVLHSSLLAKKATSSSQASVFGFPASSAPSASKEGEPRSRTTHASHLLVACVVVALGTVYYVPSTVRRPDFLTNLLAMHLIIIFPLLELLLPLSIEVPRSPLSYSQLYLLISALSIPLHLRQTIPLLRAHGLEGFALSIWKSMNSYPAQQSISWDVIFTSAVWQTWAFNELRKALITRAQSPSSGSSNRVESKAPEAWELAVSTLFVSTVPTFGTATGISGFLAMRERWLAREMGREGRYRKFE